MDYYDGTKLLSLKDANGKKPEIYICTTNRSGGKTTYFNRLAVNKWVKNKEKFCILYRYNYELESSAEQFFKNIGPLFFKYDMMNAKKMCNGKYYELYFNNDACGYSVALNDADWIKKYSHLFSDTERILFDEFQPETNRYCTDEVNKFRSIHTSFARGYGMQCRYLPTYLFSNPVTILNPYYVAMGISERLTNRANFLRGNGYVVEQGFVESASRAQRESAFNMAFGNDVYSAYNEQGIYLNDSYAFIDNPTGKNRYIATIKYNGVEYGIREYTDSGIIYCTTKVDSTYPYKIAITTNDHNINYVMLKNNDIFINMMRYFFDKGCFRFKNLKCKEAIIKCLSY